MSSGTKQLKERYRKFREWQREPRRFSVKDTSVQHCACCGHAYEGNYCPVCGQAAGEGRITWGWVRKSIMLLWGMDSHSMPYTIWNLIWRPGYLIGEYINGRRQVSYPPVKMLFIVVVFYAVIQQLFGIEAPCFNKSGVAEEIQIFLNTFNWLASHPAWAMLTMTMIMILPTWVLFRFAPKHPHHTLPEGVFIQLFMSTLMLLSIILARNVSYVFILLVPFYNYLTYRQLFGYGIWSTLWRTFICFVVWLLIVLLITVTVATCINGFMLDSIYGDLFIIAIIAVILGVCYWISKKNCHQQHADRQ